jgi:16S rRNA pseudouridine516 synthase
MGGVVVDEPEASLGELFAVDSEKTRFEGSLEVDGREWPLREHAVIMLHKPRGYECSLKPRHHPSVMSLLASPLRLRGVQPVGRLDEDTTGLLLLTDDGELNHRLTSPKWHAHKIYEVGCKHPVAADAPARLLQGVVLDDDPQPAKALAVEVMEAREAGNAPASDAQGALHPVRLTIGEGRYHQVKRMIAAVGNRVEALHRTHMGGLALDPALPVGHWRWLTPGEEAVLRASVRLD